MDMYIATSSLSPSHTRPNIHLHPHTRSNIHSHAHIRSNIYIYLSTRLHFKLLYIFNLLGNLKKLY